MGFSTIVISLIALLACMTSPGSAVIINGTRMSIDEVLMKANGRMMGQSFEGAFPSNGRILTEIDIMYSRANYERLLQDAIDPARFKRKAIRGMRWPNGRIPLQISFDLNSAERRVILGAIRTIRKYTCVRFVRRTRKDRDYVRMFNGEGCWSFIGRQGGRQDLSIGNGCAFKEIVVHELLHAIGAFHEQSRPDRDNYVIVNSNNVIPGTLQNFRRFTSSVINTFGVGYDYSSVMHYGPNAFSRNGKPTLIARKPEAQRIMGRRAGMSFQDIRIVNLMYQCTAARRCPARNCNDSIFGTTFSFQGPDCTCWCYNGDLLGGEPVNKNC